MAYKPIATPDPEWLDLDAVVHKLRAGRADAEWLEGILPATYEAPETFCKALYTYASRRAGGLKSRPGEGIDLYHDCVVVHLGQRRRAFVKSGPAGDEEISYENLHVRSAALAAAWTGAGVEPGMSIAIVAAFGVDFVVALLAALRLGAVISILSPEGPTFVRNRLDRLAPDYVVAAERQRHVLGERAAVLLPLSAPLRAGGAASSHWYAPDDPVARHLSPFGDPGGGLIEISAGALHEGLLRDSVVLGLVATDTLAAPGFDPGQFQPNLLLATLAAGSTYAEVAAEDAKSDWTIFDRLGVTVLGVPRGLRDALLRRGDAPLGRGIRAWFRSLTEVFDADRWYELGRAMWARKIPGFTVAYSSAAAGAHLFSPPSVPSPIPKVFPAPGRAFLLAELAAGALPALRAAGTYTPLRDGEPDGSGLPQMVLVREREGYVFAGSIELGRDAQAYPAAEVARVAERHPAVRHAAAILAPGRDTNDAIVILLIFTADDRGPSGRIELPVKPNEIKALVEREMGQRLLPDRIEIFPLRPRLHLGVADERWCRRQYLGGGLHAKARSELFVLLSRLEYILADAGAGA
jgi:hypothetical protein